MVDNAFEKLVEKCRKNDDPQLIQNASFEHAKVLVKNLLQKAAEKGERVRVVTGSLRSDFYNGFVDEINACFDKNSSVEIVVLEPNADFSNNEFFKTVKKRNGKIYKLTQPDPDDLSHFIVIGENRFRFEEDKQNFVAIASFNNPKLGSVLNSFFEKLLKSPLLAVV